VKAIKMLGLAALTALMAMAFVGASSAMAKEPTALCKVDELPCETENIVTHVHETTLSGAKATLLNSISNVLCDVLFLGDVLSENAGVKGLSELLEPKPGEHFWMPLLISGTFTYSNCVDEKPNSCTVTEESGPAHIDVLKLSKELAEVTGEGLVKVVCSGISCKYNGEGLSGHALGPLTSSELNGEVTLSEQTTTKVGGLLCPSTAKLDIATTPLEKVYISS